MNMKRLQCSFLTKPLSIRLLYFFSRILGTLIFCSSVFIKKQNGKEREEKKNLVPIIFSPPAFKLTFISPWGIIRRLTQ